MGGVKSYLESAPLPVNAQAKCVLLVTHGFDNGRAANGSTWTCAPFRLCIFIAVHDRRQKCVTFPFRLAKARPAPDNAMGLELAHYTLNHPYDPVC